MSRKKGVTNSVTANRKNVLDKNDTSNVPTKELMEHIQQIHLLYLEQLAFILPRFHNTPVMQALTYEAIQVLNNEFLSGVLL